MRNKLNAISYYGSKAVLCEQLITRLDYRNSKVYIELFGGGASILLNKPRHEVEIYNELDIAVYSLFYVLSKRDLGYELRDNLRKVRYEEETFLKALEIRNEYQDNPLKESLRMMNLYIKKIQQKYMLELFKDYKESNCDDDIIYKTINEVCLNDEETEEGKNLLYDYDNALIQHVPDLIDELKILLDYIGQECGAGMREIYRKKVIEETKPISIILHDINEVIKQLSVSDVKQRDSICEHADKVYKNIQSVSKDEIGLKSSNNLTIEDRMELAEATYIVHNMSRDGMGMAFSRQKNGHERFQRRVSNLLDVINRLQGVMITNIDALKVFDKKELDKAFGLYGYSDSEINFYLDPPYLQQQNRIKFDDEKIKEEIKKARSNRAYNPGLLYKTGGFDYKKHNKLLNIIYNSGYKLLVSNYRDITELYDTYLNDTSGWESLTYDTITTVGGNVSDRTEVIWYNY